MRILPHTEVDNFTDKVDVIYGSKVFIELDNGNTVKLELTEGGFQFQEESDINDLKECMKMMVTGFGLEYIRGN